MNLSIQCSNVNVKLPEKKLQISDSTIYVTHIFHNYKKLFKLFRLFKLGIVTFTLKQTNEDKSEESPPFTTYVIRALRYREIKPFRTIECSKPYCKYPSFQMSQNSRRNKAVSKTAFLLLQTLRSNTFLLLLWRIWPKCLR